MNEFRLRLSVLDYNLARLWRTLMPSKRTDRWSLTSFPRHLVKTGRRLLIHARHYWLLQAESPVSGVLFVAMLQRTSALPAPTG